MFRITSDRRQDAARRTGPVLIGALTVALISGAPAATAAQGGPGTAVAAAKLPSTVTADALPTVQIDGVAWDQVVVGNRVFVTGEFTAARPAGAAPGHRETARTNLLAYSLTTGRLITSWAPRLNAPGSAIAASSDGRRIFVGGTFTKVNGKNRSRIAALDAKTGKLVSGWKATANSRVRALAVSGSRLYLGGVFTAVDGRTRARLAAVSVSTGAVTGWAPSADAEVFALTVPAGSGKVVAGGRFTHLNSSAAYGMGALSGRGAVLPWPVTSVVRDAGPESAIYSLKNDGKQVYGSGYVYGDGGNFEGSFAARTASGSLVWVNGCRGDTYDVQPVGGVLYDVGHAHNCSPVGGNPETVPRRFQRAQAETTAAGPSGAVNAGGKFAGLRAPKLLHWLPTLAAGSYTGTTQAAWTVEGTSRYVVLGGEFPTVNGKAQQGLVRFAVSSIAPDREGPQGGAAALTPSLSVPAAGQVKLSWQAAWDRDDAKLTYQVLRGASLKTAKVVATKHRSSAWWSRPTMTFTDTSARPGAQTYRVRVSDPDHNRVTSHPATIAVASP